MEKGQYHELFKWVESACLDNQPVVIITWSDIKHDQKTVKETMYGHTINAFIPDGFVYENVVDIRSKAGVIIWMGDHKHREFGQLINNLNVPVIVMDKYELIHKMVWAEVRKLHRVMNIDIESNDEQFVSALALRLINGVSKMVEYYKRNNVKNSVKDYIETLNKQISTPENVKRDSRVSHWLIPKKDRKRKP